MIQKRAGWLTALFLGEMLTATAMGVLRSGDLEGGRARAVRAAHHLERRQLRLAGVDAGHPRAGARRGGAARLVAGDAARALAGLALGAHPRQRSASCASRSGRRSPTSTALHWLLIAWTVALSLVGVVLWGTLTGSLLPLLMRRLGFDPAASSAPFVATLVDVTGLVIYFTRGARRPARNAAVDRRQKSEQESEGRRRRTGGECSRPESRIPLNFPRNAHDFSSTSPHDARRSPRRDQGARMVRVRRWGSSKEES